MNIDVIESQIFECLPECAICYEPLNKRLATSGSCGHVFHSTWYLFF